MYIERILKLLSEGKTSFEDFVRSLGLKPMEEEAVLKAAVINEVKIRAEARNEFQLELDKAKEDNIRLAKDNLELNSVNGILRSEINTLKEDKEVGKKDDLTTLLLRKFFLEEMENALSHRRRSDAPWFLFVYADLTKFKEINDTYGHPCGDLTLKETGFVLRTYFHRGTDLVGRLGGDELCILVRNVRDRASCERMASDGLKKLLKMYSEVEFRAKFLPNILDRELEMDLGAICFQNPRPVQDIIGIADGCMYVAKKYPYRNSHPELAEKFPRVIETEGGRIYFEVLD